MSSSLVRKTDGEKMRNINFRICALPASLLAMTMVANLGCSTGSGSSTGTAGSSGGSAGATAGSAGANGGTAGASSGGTAGTVGGGSAGTTGGGTAGSSGGTAGTTAGGTAGMAGLPTTGVCAGTGTRSLTVAQGAVDDFEEATILSGWSSFNDVTAAPDAIHIMQEAGGALQTGHGGHYMGSGALTPVTGGYGVGTVYNMAIDMMSTPPIYCVDITAFDGLTFWAKLGTTAATSTKISVNFVVPDQNALKDGGDCDLTKTTCYNHPQKSLTLTTDWAQYTVPFASAVGAKGAKVTSVIQELEFLSPDASWDFWLDELQLYKGTAPMTPVMGNSTM
jgi:hypothetical protein